MWRRITTKAEIAEMISSIQLGSINYDNLDARTFRRIEKQGGEAWQWSAAYRINLVVIPKPVVNAMKIHIFIPEGTFQPRQAFRKGVTKIRQIVDASEYLDTYGLVPVDNKDVKLDAFFAEIKGSVWDKLDDLPVKGATQHYRFNRPVNRRNEDLKWEGKKIGRRIP